MRFTLKDYQETAYNDVMKALRRATRDLTEDATEYHAISLSAPTGAGKTVIASAVIEALFNGSGHFAEDPNATVLWVTDDPALNEQTKRKMIAASDLTPGQLVTIDASFDESTFAKRKVYFLNIQKLARTNPLAKSNNNNRTYSLWQTISNTITARGANFYVIIDEAHRGMKSESDRETIVSRIVHGQAGANLPAPIVLGISATPQRFQSAMTGRNSRAIPIRVEDVRSSGLLKNLIVLDNPAAAQHTGDTTLVRAAAAKTLEFETSWAAYAESQGEPPVLPVLVVQVNNTPSDAEMGELLGAIFGAWPGLTDHNVVNTFGEHTTLSVGPHTVRYMAPQEIQDDIDVRVVLCKDAISTGWDCPRAEVLVSLRRAQDHTYITQLIGRMVRTPLARRISTDQTLNTVNTYLPYFNKQQVESIVERFASGENDEPPVTVITKPVRIWRNPDVTEEIFGLLGDLPTYLVPGKAYRTQVSRLFKFAALLTGDNIVEGAISHARQHLVNALEGERSRLEADGTLQATVRQIKSLKIERSFALLAAESVADLPSQELAYEMSLDTNNIEDLFKVAKRKLPEGVAQAYWNKIIDAQPNDDWDPLEAKAIVAALALHPDAVESVEAAAESLVRIWLREHQKSISLLKDAHKAHYEPVKREARDSELTDLIVPETDVVPDSDKRWHKHLLCDENQMYPEELKGWESRILDIELADEELAAWYRNPTGGQGAIRVPFPGDHHDKPMYPDFVFFHQTDDGVRASIVDPHSYHLADAAAKLRGLADYAETHEDAFMRIESVVEDPQGQLLALDMKSATVRDAVRELGDMSVLSVYAEHGGRYN
jgi:type III restriction enzyme